MRRNHERGSSMLEFTLVAIPIIFVIISILEISRGMWSYHSLVFAVKHGTRFASVHGQNCATAPNACTVTTGQIATLIRNMGAGLEATRTNLTFTSRAGSFTCRLDNCVTRGDVWPPAASEANLVGRNVEIQGTHSYQSLVTLFWPGAGGPMTFGAFNLPAASREQIQF